jgi:hypothetical protein
MFVENLMDDLIELIENHPQAIYSKEHACNDKLSLLSNYENVCSWFTVT